MSTITGRDIAFIEDVILEVFEKNNLNKNFLLCWTFDQYEHLDCPTVLLIFDIKAYDHIHVTKGLELCRQIEETLEACGLNFHLSFTFSKRLSATRKGTSHARQNAEPTSSH